MLRITDIISQEQVYDYQMCLTAPYFFSADFGSWKKSFSNDVDGEGRLLFKELHGKVAYDDDIIVGFIQYGIGSCEARMVCPINWELWGVWRNMFAVECPAKKWCIVQPYIFRWISIR